MTPAKNLSRSEILTRVASVSTWYHQIEVAPGIVTPGSNSSREVLGSLQIPPDCSGLSALDIGTRDGFFAFELEKRGARVTAIDYMQSSATGFDVAAELLGSKVTYIQESVYDISADKYGTFDVVLFLGVLYHLPDPLGALDIIRRVCRDTLYLETHVIDEALLLPNGEFATLDSVSPRLKDIPIMQFYPADVLKRDYTNFWAPNLMCLERMLVESGFSIVRKSLRGDRAIVQSRRGPEPRKSYYAQLARTIVKREEG